MKKQYVVFLIVLIEMIALAAVILYYNQPKDSPLVPSEPLPIESSEIKDIRNPNSDILLEKWNSMLKGNESYSDEIQKRINKWSKNEPKIIKQKVEELATLYKRLVHPSNTDDQYLTVLQRISGIEGCLLFADKPKYEKMLSARDILIENKNHLEMIVLRERMLENPPSGIRLPFDSPKEYKEYCRKFLKGQVSEPPLDKFIF